MKSKTYNQIQELSTLNVVIPDLQSLPANELIDFLNDNLIHIDYKLLMNLISNPPSTLVLTIVRDAIRCKEKQVPLTLTLEKAERKTLSILINRRKKLVRRAYKSQPLFAMDLIKKVYPDYSIDMLFDDLKLRAKKLNREKFVKRPSMFGFRLAQIDKLSRKLNYLEPNSKEYNKCCNLIATMNNNHNSKAPILLKVHYSGDWHEYPFAWNARENVIKSFVNLTKQVSSFKELDDKLINQKSYGK